jgi:dihydrolipoamide dehydrogenase
MADYDVIVLGGGPAGYAAALTAAEAGAQVALVEPERLGGACVNFSCIPTNIFLGAVATHLDARELAVLGVFEAGDRFNFARAVARKDALVRMLGDGIGAALRQRKVTHIQGRGSFRDPSTVAVSGAGGTTALGSEAFVVATGTRWDPPAIPGVPPERVLTADAVQALPVAPTSALVLGGGPAATAFALEYATLLAAAGTTVTLLAPGEQLLPALDAEMSEAAGTFLGDLGINVRCGWAIVEGNGTAITLSRRDATSTVEAEVVVAADVRRPFIEGLGLESAGVTATDCIPVGNDCRTNVPHIFAAGDVTGGVMLTSAATHMGEVAGANAVGREARTRLHALPYLLHTTPEIGWVGRTEAEARAAGYQVRVGLADLAANPRAVAMGARQGAVKVMAGTELGEILGVQVIGPGSGEIISVAAALMQAEVSIQDLAALVAWHPSMTESLVEAARRAIRRE